MIEDLITDLDEIRHLANQRNDEFDVIRHLLQMDEDLDDTLLDQLVNQIASQIAHRIDCTTCGNCCRSLHVYVTPTDIDRLKPYIETLQPDIATHLLDHASAKAHDEWARFHHQPCVFLKNNLCSVYESRPDTCRAYPAFTPDFRWLMADFIAGSAICPIIYHVLDAITTIADDLSAGRIEKYIQQP